MNALYFLHSTLSLSLCPSNHIIDISILGGLLRFQHPLPIQFIWARRFSEQKLHRRARRTRRGRCFATSILLRTRDWRGGPDGGCFMELAPHLFLEGVRNMKMADLYVNRIWAIYCSVHGKMLATATSSILSQHPSERLGRTNSSADRK